jgi:hypothetical protein
LEALRSARVIASNRPADRNERLLAVSSWRIHISAAALLLLLELHCGLRSWRTCDVKKCPMKIWKEQKNEESATHVVRRAGLGVIAPGGWVG